MATRVLGPGSLKIGETASAREFATDLSKAGINVSTDSEDDIPLLDGNNETGVDTDSFTLVGTLLQSFEFDSLEMFCFTNRGQLMPFIFTPANEGGIDWSGVVKIRPVNIGGDVKKKNTSDFEFPIVGNPTPGAHVAI